VTRPMLDVGQLSANDHATLEELTGHNLTAMDGLGYVERITVMATAWWLQCRRHDADFALEDALNTPTVEYVPGVQEALADLDPTKPSGGSPSPGRARKGS